jgi:hypothetical protein
MNLQEMLDELILELIDSGNPNKKKDLMPKEADAEVLKAIKKAMDVHNMSFDEYFEYMKERIG